MIDDVKFLFCLCWCEFSSVLKNSLVLRVMSYLIILDRQLRTEINISVKWVIIQVGSSKSYFYHWYN